MPAQNKGTRQTQDVESESTLKREPEKELFTWRAPARPFKRKDREFWVTVGAMAGISGLILFFVEGFMPVILIISVTFLFYILSTVEPQVIEYKITNKGIKIEDKKTEWQDIVRFWFGKRFDNNLLILETLNLGGRLELIIDQKDVEKIRKTLSSYIPEEEAPATNIDKITDWVGKKMPGAKASS